MCYTNRVTFRDLRKSHAAFSYQYPLSMNNAAASPPSHPKIQSLKRQTKSLPCRPQSFEQWYYQLTSICITAAKNKPMKKQEMDLHQIHEEIAFKTRDPEIFCPFKPLQTVESPNLSLMKVTTKSLYHQNLWKQSPFVLFHKSLFRSMWNCEGVKTNPEIVCIGMNIKIKKHQLLFSLLRGLVSASETVSGKISGFFFHFWCKWVIHPPKKKKKKSLTFLVDVKWFIKSSLRFYTFLEVRELCVGETK